ncbi:hypothetical protein HAALTHF_31310n [Vreelandella aquamarina]|nr:hypothetical protein HAALTHF_31310n [Halomonas axialensis]
MERATQELKQQKLRSTVKSANLTVQFVRAEFIELLTDYTLAFEEVGRALQ